MVSFRDPTSSKLITTASVGSEMTAMIVVGLAVDYWLNVMPVFTIVGAIFGLVVGIAHLVILNRPNRPKS